MLFLTGDESWFYLETNYEMVWLPSNESPPEKEKRMITDKKMMLTVFWIPEGFLVVDVLPHGQKFNSEYFINNILQPIYRSLSSRAKELKESNISPPVLISNFLGRTPSLNIIFEFNKLFVILVN